MTLAKLPLCLWLALVLPLLLLWGGCKRTKYTCPAYQSAFVLDLPAYKISAEQDSMAASADTSLDVDVIAVLAERIRTTPALRYEYDADSVPKFPESSVIKTNVLLIKRISRKRKDKLMATVPMITVFPVVPDSIKEKNMELRERKGRKDPRANEEAPKEDEGQNNEVPPAEGLEAPAEEPKKEGDGKS